MDAELGTIYSVALPVKRVKPLVRLQMAAAAGEGGGGAPAYDPADLDSDPSSQFPYGA